jgi:hypothetical protein
MELGAYLWVLVGKFRLLENLYSMVHVSRKLSCLLPKRRPLNDFVKPEHLRCHDVEQIIVLGLVRCTQRQALVRLDDL